jgi:hypothetical protein
MWLFCYIFVIFWKKEKKYVKQEVRNEKINFWILEIILLN